MYLMSKDIIIAEYDFNNISELVKEIRNETS